MNGTRPSQATNFPSVPPRTQSAPPTTTQPPPGRGSLNATAQPFNPPPNSYQQQPNPMYTQQPPFYPDASLSPYPYHMHYQFQQYPYYQQNPSSQSMHHHHHHHHHHQMRGIMPSMPPPMTYMHHQQPHHHHHQPHIQHSHPPSHQHQHQQHHHHQHQHQHAQQKPDDSPKRQSNVWNVQSDLSGVRAAESPKTNQESNEDETDVQSSEEAPQEENIQAAKQTQRTQQGNKKTYSVDFLLKFQNEQTNPPEKIKLFSEIYIDDNLPSPQGKRATNKKNKPSGSPTTATPPQPNISSPVQGMNPVLPRYVPGIPLANATPPPYYQRNQPITEYSHRAPDPYKPISPTEEIQSVAKKVVGILNRLTPEKYDLLMNEILLINFDTNNTELLNEIIRCVFECAVTQTSLSNMYADLCKDLTQKFAQAQKSKETEESGRSAYASFRRALLNKCQTEFEKPQTIPASANLSKEERDEAESKLRQRQLGNIKFIGELFKRKMLTEKIMHEVIKRLLLGCPPKEDHVPTDEEIEVLCKLLTTVGNMLDRQQASTYMNHYFEKMKKLLTHHPRQRIRFMLQDVIELRDTNWVPRREEQRPQTLSELESSLTRKQIEQQEQFTRPRLNPVTHNHVPNPNVPNQPFSPTHVSPNNSPPPPAASSPIHQPSSPPQAKVPPIPNPSKPKPEPTRKPQLAKPEPSLPPSAAPAANPPKQPAVPPPVVKPEKDNTTTHTPESSKPQPKAKPKAIEDESVTSKLMDEAALETAAHSLLEEFKNSTQESDLHDNLRQVGESNHQNLFRKAIEGSTISLARHSTERKLLAGLLRHILEHEDESGTRKPLVSPKVIYGSFSAFVQYALDPEDGLLEDNPKLWECFADLLVQCFLEHTINYSTLNYCIPDELFQHTSQFLPFVVALFKRIKQERSATLICCSGHFEILQKLFCATRTTERIDELLKTFQSNDLLEVDVTIYLYYCYKTKVPIDDILILLQSRIPEALSTSSIISQKVASPTILYSAVATDLFVEASKKPEPRVLFSKLVELFNNQLTKPILKYTQNDSTDKLENELQCLIEAQKFCYLTGYQGGILCNYFQVFYEVEVVMEDTYYMWRNQTNADFGKEQALKEVQSFLSFLEKGDEEAGDEAESEQAGP